MPPKSTTSGRKPLVLPLQAGNPWCFVTKDVLGRVQKWCPCQDTALALKGMLFRHCSALSLVSICCSVLLTLLWSFIICCSCSCSSLLEAIPSIVSCTILSLYASIRAVVSTSNRRKTWVKSMALIKSCADKCPCLSTVPEYYLWRECPYPGNMLEFLYRHH